ncbi:MAG: hypothetical protein ABIH21_05575 [Patescibacteria group bacterium]
MRKLFRGWWRKLASDPMIEYFLSFLESVRAQGRYEAWIKKNPHMRIESSRPSN